MWVWIAEKVYKVRVQRSRSQRGQLHFSGWWIGLPVGRLTTSHVWMRRRDIFRWFGVVADVSRLLYRVSFHKESARDVCRITPRRTTRLVLWSIQSTCRRSRSSTGNMLHRTIVMRRLWIYVLKFDTILNSSHKPWKYYNIMIREYWSTNNACHHGKKEQVLVTWHYKLFWCNL